MYRKIQQWIERHTGLGRVQGKTVDFTASPYTEGRFYLANSTSADVDVTLPSASLFEGLPITIVKTVAANLVNVATVEGGTIILHSQYDRVTVISDGSAWYRVEGGAALPSRAVVGPFVAPGAAGVVAASQTNLDMRYSHVSATTLGWLSDRVGSIVGISAELSAAITGAGTTLDVSVHVDSTELVSGPTAAFTQAGAEVEAFDTAARGAFPFAAGARIGLSYTSTAISNTPVLVASLHIEF